VKHVILAVLLVFQEQIAHNVLLASIQAMEIAHLAYNIVKIA